MMNKRSMILFGNSILSIDPNIAEIKLGVVTEELELKTAQQKNAGIIQQIINSIIELGISEEKINTSEYTIYPRYDYVDGIQKFKGYQVKHILNITITNLDKTGVIIDTAVGIGANEVENINFIVKNKDSYYQRALAMALEDTLVKAQTIANTLRLNLDPKPVKITEQSTEQPLVPYQPAISSELVDGSSTPIQPGRIDIEARIEVEFLYFS
ncbi:SIMPL domain-containing protein [Aquibacillus halophilus]|nr:SIMPL domain-containing protein [Aquibacillus halophilus]